MAKTLENKYIVTKDLSPVTLAEAGWTRTLLSQGFLESGSSVINLDGSYYYSNKHWHADKQDYVAMATEVNAEDYTELHDECGAFVSIDRYRHIDAATNAIWTVDFVNDTDGKVAMIRASVKAEDGMDALAKLPAPLSAAMLSEMPANAIMGATAQLLKMAA